MKKLIYGTLFLAIVGIGVTGCKKEKVSQSTHQQIQKKNEPLSSESIISSVYPFITLVNYDYLKFQSIDQYINFIENSSDSRDQLFIKEVTNLNFNHYFTIDGRSEFQDTTDDGIDLEMDHFFGHVLNTEGVVQLGDYICRVSLEDKSVYVIGASKKQTAYLDLKSGNLQNSDVSRYSTDDDVIDVLLGSFLPKAKCKGSDSFNKYSRKITNVGKLTVGESVDFQARYFKFGIYFSVRIKGHHYPGLLGFVSSPNLQFEIKTESPNWKGMRMRPIPCSNGNNVYHTAGLRNFTQSAVFSGLNSITKVFKGYERVRGLNGYRVWVRGYIDGTIGHNDWIGREVNSNF